ncbi:MAG: TlpA family protein disulfide reductase [Prosthecobacter sp.]|uniref:TlpA family protein disulfide reductase n=1 Tax=Prosthecobacter sp. TaxID=1965333 RepID=UPI003901E48E
MKHSLLLRIGVATLFVAVSSSLMAAAGDAEWKKVEAALDAIKNPKEKPKSREEAIANLKAGLKEFDAAHADAMKASTANPVRWSAAVFNAKIEKSRGIVGAPPVENLTAELEALVKAGDASTEDKAAAEKALKTIKTMAELKSKPLNLKFTAVDGREVDLEKMRGKVVLIDFWATWCGPCVAELPNVLKAYKELHPKGFEIVGISLDSDKAKLEKFVKDKGMEWPQFFDGKGWKNEISSGFSINSIPAMWLVNQDGMVIDTAARGGLEEKVAKLLK